MKKQLLSLFLAVCMVLGMLPSSAIATEGGNSNYELRYLTFEDQDYRGGTNYAGGANWSSLIDEPQYGGSLLYPQGAAKAYNWYDKGNTELAHTFADEWGDHQYWGGGHAVSHYNSGDIDATGDYQSQLTVYKPGVSGVATTGGGHNGSKNFAVHYGYVDSSGYGGTILQSFYFGDGKERVVDHMYVNNTNYALNCFVNGNDLTANIGEDDWVKLVATGYDASGHTTGTSEIYLCNGPDNIMMDWTKWDLSGLGKVLKVTFNVTGSSDNGYGFSQPAYFAYDDVAVRFEVHNHKYEEPVWNWAEDYSSATAVFSCKDGDDTQTVSAEVTSETTATCTEDGKTLYTATAIFQDVEYTDSKEVDTLAVGHHVDENGDRICDACGVSLNSVPTLIAGVDAERTVTIKTGYSYQLHDLEQGRIFEDADGDKLDYSSYFYSRSDDGGKTWTDKIGFTASMFGGTDMSLIHNAAGTYIYKFWAYDGYGYSEDTWTLTLEVADVVPAEINFYVSQDQNYKTNGNVYPILELYKTAGVDEDLYDYVGWYQDAEGKTQYVYNPADYEIVDGEAADYVVIDGVSYELHDYEKIAFTNSAFDDADTAATASNTVVNNYNMFYAAIESGRYSTRAYGYNKTTQAYDVYLGGQSLELPMEKDIYGGGGSDIYLRVVSCYTTSKKIDNTYFNANDYYVNMIMPVTGGMIHAGDAYTSGNYTYYPFMSYAAGNASLYNTYAYPYDTENYIFGQTINNTTTAGYTVVNKSVAISTAMTLTVNVPENAEFGLYFQYNNFNTKEVMPEGAAISNGDGTQKLTYKVSKSNSNYTWRLRDLSGVYVTKGGWLGSITAATEKTFGFASGDAIDKKSHDTGSLGTTVAARDEADIQVFLTHSGFLSTTGTYRARAYRLWQMIDSDTANIMLEPDFHMQVLQGNPSDIQAVSGGNASNNWMDITPTTTDIIAINYDAMDVYTANGTYGSHGGLFPATTPERTSVMVVTNQAAGTADASISYNSDGTTTSRSKEWDYNYDTWYYLNTDETPALNFTVSGSGAVDVSYAIVTTDAALNSTLSDWTSVAADENGGYAASLAGFSKAGTKGGTVIIRMTDGTGTSYRLVHVNEMAVSIENATNPGEPLTPGVSATLTFSGLYRGFDKYSGIFNPTTLYLYYGNDGSGQLGQYQQMDRVSATLKVPETLEFAEGETETTYTFTNGYIYGSMYAASNPFDTLYNMTDTGVGTNFSAVSINFCLSKLADIPVTVTKEQRYDVALRVMDGENALSGCTVTLTDPSGNTVTADDEGIYRNLGWGAYSYCLELAGYVRQTGELKIGSGDAANVENGILTKTLVMVKGLDGAWDGVSAEEPKTDANGVYQISNGAELAWFAASVGSGNAAAKAVLTADIDLANYEWTPIGSNANQFTGSFDGQNFRIIHLAIHKTAGVTYQALFGYAKDAVISNLHVEGSVCLSDANTLVSKTYAAGVVGCAVGATLQNVHSDVAVTANRTRGNWENVGGVVGYASSCRIENCSNSGNISGYNYVGGIAGTAESTTLITNCFNSGSISGNMYAAGITGAGKDSKIVSCYHIGAVSGSSSSAGIAGLVSGTAEVRNCFNAGNIEKKNAANGAVIGYSNNAGGVNANLYYLDGTALQGIGNNKNTVGAEAVDAKTMASAAFVATMNAGLEEAAFVLGERHPVLSWQGGREPAEFKVTRPEDNEAYTVYGKATAIEGKDYTFTVYCKVGYQRGPDFKVKVNGEILTENANGSYTVPSVASDLTITVEGVEAIVWNPVTVYFSMSHDGVYRDDGDSGAVMALKEIKVPYFDLGLYGLEDFYFNSETYGDDGDGQPGSDLLPGTAEYAYGKITMLHLFIYATEVYYCGIDESEAGKGYLYDENILGSDTMSITGSTGSSYLSHFWGYDENLNYYLNYKYPLASPGWGSTSDQILLHDGDIVTMGHFTDWGFYQDDGGIFNFMQAGSVIGKVTATQGDKIKMTHMVAGASDAGNYETSHKPSTMEAAVYAIRLDELTDGDPTTWTLVATANKDGQFTIDTTGWVAGQYIVAVPGQHGKTETDAICSAPGAILVNLEKAAAVMGDFNGNGVFDAMDVSAMMRALRNKDELTKAQLSVCDFDGDGAFTVVDLSLAAIAYRMKK